MALRLKLTLYALLIIGVLFTPLLSTPIIREAYATGITCVQGHTGCTDSVVARGTWSSGTTFTVTLDVTPTSGNIIILGEGGFAPTGTGVTVSSISQTGGTWSGSGNGLQIAKVSAASIHTEIWMGTASASAGAVITITLSGTPIANSQYVGDAFEYSGLQSASTVLDKTGSNSDQTVHVTDTGTTGTTSLPIELWVGSVFGDAAQTTPTNGFTLVDGTTNWSEAYLDKIVSSTGAANSGTTFGGFADYAGAIATFKGPASASPSDSFSQSDVLVRNFVGGRGVVDVGSWVDVLGRSYTRGRFISDVLAWQDTVTRKFNGKNYLLADTLNITDFRSVTKGSGGHNYIQKYLGDSLTLIDSLSRKYVGGATLSDAVSWVDSLTKLRNIPLSLSDVLGIAENLIRLGPPAAPASVSASQNPSTPQTAIDLTWTESDTYPGMTYTVEKSVDSSTWATAGTSSITSYTASGLAPGYAWYFRVRL